jgi:hypothetical protein
MNQIDEQRHDPGTDQVQAAVTALVEGIYASLRVIGSELRSLWDRFEDNGIAPKSTDLAVLRDVVIGELKRHGRLFNGAGVVVADRLLADRPRYLEWWRSHPSNGEASQKLNLDLNPRSEYFYDYSTMEWFAVPRDRGIQWVYGPYLDYAGADLYVCTFAVPVSSRGGTFLGVAGGDVPVARIDAALMPKLQSSRRALALTNAEGRVIVANHADHVAGSKLNSRSATGPSRPVPATPWTLVPLD